jgi:zinc transport system substrate-binding protein
MAQGLGVGTAIAFGLWGCVPSSSQVEAPPISPAKDELQVVTTFLPITQFTQAVAGDRAEVTQLLPESVGPHDYQAKPEDAQNLAEADVLVKNGLDLEEFLNDLIQNAGNSNLKVIDSSRGVQTIKEEGHAEENHAEEGHGHGGINPHIWLDPKRAIQQVENIRDGLIAVDPEGKAVYTANAASYIQKLRELDGEAAAALKPFANQSFVSFHDIAPYFAESYNLKAVFLVDVPEENPSPNDVKRVMDTVKTTGLKTLLTEPQTEGGAFLTMAQDLNVKVSQFDPMETGGVSSSQSDYYLTTMRQNIGTLATAFAK